MRRSKPADPNGDRRGHIKDIKVSIAEAATIAFARQHLARTMPQQCADSLIGCDFKPVRSDGGWFSRLAGIAVAHRGSE
jgi:hypothetical protein